MNDDSKENQSGIGDVFKGLGRLVNTIIDMAENGINEKKGSGEFSGTGSNDGMHGKYGFSMKLGLGEKDIGHIVKNLQVTEPQTDIFKEDGHTAVVVELPGVRQEDFEYNIQGDHLHIIGRDDMRTYKKIIDLSGLNIDPNGITVIENNGIYKLDIKHSEP